MARSLGEVATSRVDQVVRCIDAVEFLPDGWLVSSDAQRRLLVYDPGGAVLRDLEIPTRAMSLRVDGSRLVTVPMHNGGRRTAGAGRP